MTTFSKLKDQEGEFYTTSKAFGKSVYYLYFHIDRTTVTVALSSGNKRKHKFTFSDKLSKSEGGIKALIWAKNTVEEFPVWYSKTFKYWLPTLTRICIIPENSRKRRIYKRGLANLNYREMRHPIYGLILEKKLTI